MKKTTKDFLNIEKDFFEIDEEEKTAHIDLDYQTPADLFDPNCKAKTPMFTDDFDSWIDSSFDMVPNRYDIVLDIRFTDMAGYEQEQLEKIFRKNLMLSFKSVYLRYARRTKIAISLIVFGLLFFAAMLLVGHFWADGGVFHDAFFYIFDIFTTVLFWEAAGILLVENHELRQKMRGFHDRFKKITFRQVEQ